VHGTTDESTQGTKTMKNIFARKTALVVVLPFILSPAVSFSASKEKSAAIQATVAALVMQSLQLGEKAQDLFCIKDNLIKIVNTKRGNFTSQDGLLVDAANEIKYVATVAYFEGNLLGAVLAIKDEFKLQFIENRISELDHAFSGTISSLQAIQIVHSGVENPAVKNYLVKTMKIVKLLLETYRNGIEVLQKIKEQEITQQQ
jgi:hypothetical protein